MIGRRRIAALLAGVLMLAPAAMAMAGAPDPSAVARGAYIFAAADCAGCHTDVKNAGKPLAGGRALTTPFGTFFTPNITPDPRDGLGRWSLGDFRRALHEGVSPEGYDYFPAFPYTAFTAMSDGDIADLWAYLRTLAPVAQADRPHALTPPFGWRFLLPAWRLLFFRAGPLPPAPGKNAEWRRGDYLVNAVAHCGECHTPRNWLGGLERSRGFAGNPAGPDGQKAPNITPDAKTGIGDWSVEDITTLLKSGQTPDFETVGRGMAEVVKGTAALTDSDRRAIAAYLKALPAIAAPSGATD